jgi:hypothetical protein
MRRFVWMSFVAMVLVISLAGVITAAPVGYRVVGMDSPEEAARGYIDDLPGLVVNDTTGTTPTAQETKDITVPVVILVIWLGVMGFVVSRTWDGKAIFYNSYVDLFISYMPGIAFAILHFVEGVPPESAGVIKILSITFAVIYNFARAIQLNAGHPIVGLSVGIGRMTLGYVLPFLAVALSVTGGNAKRRDESDEAYELRSLNNTIMVMGMIGGALALIKSLVGRERYDLFHSTLMRARPAVPMTPEQEYINDCLMCPDIRPATFDQTVEAWFCRISQWGAVHAVHIDNRTRKRTRMTKNALLTTMQVQAPEDKWDIEKLDVNSLVLHREDEDIFITVDAKEELQKAAELQGE